MLGKLAYKFEAFALSAVLLPQIGDAVTVLLRMVVADVVAQGPGTGPALARDAVSTNAKSFICVGNFMDFMSVNDCRALNVDFLDKKYPNGRIRKPFKDHLFSASARLYLPYFLAN